MSPQRQGFSLFEMLICISILSILLFISLPSMTSMTSNQRVSTQITQIRQALYLARSLAVTQGQVWKVCLLDVSNSCVKEGGKSLVVFRDDNNDHQLNSNETVKKTSEIRGVKIKLSASNRTYMRFKITGESKESGSFKVCLVDSMKIYGGKVIIYRSGRVRVSMDQFSNC
ncbi:GspH/FimT family pseudopilin [Porticoccaceae bacterium nBUS_09]